MARNPTITATIRDVDADTIALTGDSSVLIRYRSDAYVTVTPTAYDGASINEDTLIIRNGNDTGFGYTCTFEDVGVNAFRLSVEDSNGLLGTKTVSASSMIPYVELTCHMSNNKPDADGTMRVECSGDYYNGSFGAKSNTLTVQYRYAKSGGSYSTWRSMTVSKSGNSYTAYANLTGLDYRSSYSFEVLAEDELTITSSAEAGVSSLPVFHWGAEDFVFEVPVTFNAGAEGLALSEVEGDLTVSGDLRLQESGSNYGNKLLFGDGQYCYIGEETDDDMTLHASTINFETEQLQLNGENVQMPVYGLWTPELDDSAISYYSTRKGWYIRSGYVVTIGFYIKAQCDSGYEDYDVIITGLPHTASCSASGGGICSGAFVAANKTFQCFVVEDGESEITVRVQDCANEYDENLGTSASGCGYPENGGALTLSGTITYMTEDF